MISEPFTMIVCIVFIAIAGGIVMTWIEARKEVEKSADAAETERLRAEVEELKDRVRILEKLVTSEERSLREEFRNIA